MTKTTVIILGAQNFLDNPYDGDTLKAVLIQIKKMTYQEPTNAFCDCGFRGRNEIANTKTHIPDTFPASSLSSDKRKAKKNFGRRSALEPVIGHLKSDFRQEAPAAVARNFLKGTAMLSTYSWQPQPLISQNG